MIIIMLYAGVVPRKELHESWEAATSTINSTSTITSTTTTTTTDATTTATTATTNATHSTQAWCHGKSYTRHGKLLSSSTPPFPP